MGLAAFTKCGLSTWTVATGTEELNFKFYLIFVNLNLNSHMWLVMTILEWV